MKNQKLAAEIKSNYLFMAVIALFVALLFRNSGLYPVVFADEYTYSKFSRLLPLADSPIPGYLYLAIYRLTNICGDGFLDCARMLNALFFVASAPFIYLIARRVCSPSIASMAVILTLLGPINSYTAYFMPEALYFLSFWLLSWFILRLDNASNSGSWFFAGILLGISALIKPHALFLLPALVVYTLFVCRKNAAAWVLSALRNAAVLVASTFATKFLIGYWFAGKAGVTIFGSFYTSMASTATTTVQMYLELLALTGESIKGHVLVICVIFGVPMASAIYASLNALTSKQEIKAEQNISFYALVVLSSLIVVVALFTASTAMTEQNATDVRLHMRYYNFALPLLLLVAASRLSSESTAGTRKSRALIAFPIGAAILYAAYTHLAPYLPSLIDNPELRGFTFIPAVFYVLSGIALCTLILWVYADRAGAKSFVYLFMPLAVVVSTVAVNHELRHRLVADAFDKAGTFTKQYLSDGDIAKVVVVGSEEAGLFRSLFYLDNPKASFETIPKGSAYDKHPAGKEWILLIGDHTLTENTFHQLRTFDKLQMTGFVLAHPTGTTTFGETGEGITVDFKKSAWPGVISSAQGLSSTEPWGTWSASDTVILEFSKPLPDKFNIHLIANAFGQNAGKEFVARVGESAIRFTLGATTEEKLLEFNNPSKAKIIRIDVPSAVSPKALGLSGDERRLGIALTELRVAPRNILQNKKSP